MKQKLVIIFCIFLLLGLFFGCSKKADDDTRSTAVEKNDAELLSLSMTKMNGNISEYDTILGSGAKFRGPPSPWEGPAAFETPDGNTTSWYWWKGPWGDTTKADSMLHLLMQTPDRWADTSVAFVTKVEVWLCQQIDNTIWFHFAIEMDSTDLTHISGMWKWHYQETWLEFTFLDMGTEDYSGTIDINTSNNISLSAHFSFNIDGDGTGWGKFQDIKFVEYTFYTMGSQYRGYFTLASEGWNVKHYFYY